MGFCLIGLIFGMILLVGAMKISNRVAPDVVDIDEDLHALDIEDVYHLSDQVAILGLVRIIFELIKLYNGYDYIMGRNPIV